MTSQPQNCRKSVGNFQSQFAAALSLSLSSSLSIALAVSFFFYFWFISLAQKLLYFDSRQTNVRIEIKREAATGSAGSASGKVGESTKRRRGRNRNRHVGSRITPISVAPTPPRPPLPPLPPRPLTPPSFDCYTHTYAFQSTDFLAFPHSHSHSLWFWRAHAAFICCFCTFHTA